MAFQRHSGVVYPSAALECAPFFDAFAQLVPGLTGSKISICLRGILTRIFLLPGFSD
jgi:hypothetical protein